METIATARRGSSRFGQLRLCSLRVACAAMNTNGTYLVIAIGEASGEKVLRARLNAALPCRQCRIALCLLPSNSVSSDPEELSAKLFRAIRRSQGHRHDYKRVPYAFGEMMDTLHAASFGAHGAVLFPREWVAGIVQRTAQDMLACFSVGPCDDREPWVVLMEQPPVRESVAAAARAFSKAAELAGALFPVEPGWLGFRDCADAWAHFLHHFQEGAALSVSGTLPNAENRARIWHDTILDTSAWSNWIHAVAYPPDNDGDLPLAVARFYEERLATRTWSVLDGANPGDSPAP